MTVRRCPVFVALGAVLFLARGAHAQAPAGEPAAPPAAAPPASPAGEAAPAAPAAAPPAEAAPLPPPPPPPAAAPPPAAPPPAPLPEAPPPADAVPMGVGAETHDGFYMRISLGGGGLSMQRDTEGSGPSGLLYSGGESSINGAAGHFELSIGGTPGGGLAIAGTILTYSIQEPTLENDSGGEVEMGGPLNFAVLGASVDWFPNKHGGFHFGGTLGLAAASAETPEGSPFEFIGGFGGALSLAVGYDWWIGEEWSLGVQGRLTGAGVAGEATENVPNVGEVTGKESSSLSAFTIAITVLHH